MDAMGGEFVGEQWIVPIGLSFFTFQALSYLYDVYYEKIKTEKNLWDYMLFVAFFPQILSGPINRANELLPQIKNNRSFNYEKTAFGFKQMLYGMFLKVVLADRLGMYVDTVYGDWSLQTGVTCAVASVAYSLQIYADFAGYSLMAIGVGHILGFDFANNFNRPYFSVSVTDFWHRWHISLSSWLRDYVYIPLGGSRCSKKKKLCKHNDNILGQWYLAWSKLDIHSMGIDTWFVPSNRKNSWIE
ncbi:MBOAT family O-acyltransferase [Bacteroides thetaiotaomicron]